MTSEKRRRSLLISGTLPGEPGVGGVILDDAIRHVGAESVDCFWLSSRASTAQVPIASLSVRRVTRRYETCWRPMANVLGEIASRVTYTMVRPRFLRQCSRILNEEILTAGYKQIVVVLESVASIEVAYGLLTNLRIPLKAIVWDDVDLFCRHSNHDRWTRKNVIHKFVAVLRACTEVYTIGESMQEYYLEKYNVNSQILRHGVRGIEQSQTSSSTASSAFRIGFAGSITAPDCIASLIECLNKSNWQLQGKPVVLRLLGARFLLDSRVPQHIEFFGWRTVEETQYLLAQCDLLYLPQSFEESQELFSRLSFPTKLSTYVTAGRRIFLHAPEYSSLARLWRDYPMGPHCRELDADALCQHFQSLADGSERETIWARGVEMCAATVLNRERFLAMVERVFGNKSGEHLSMARISETR